jgi:hypothetical protein
VAAASAASACATPDRTALSGLVCVADRSAEGRPKGQDVRALTVDAEVQRLILEAMRPDRIALAVVALGEIEVQAQAMERRWMSIGTQKRLWIGVQRDPGGTACAICGPQPPDRAFNGLRRPLDIQH